MADPQPGQAEDEKEQKSESDDSMTPDTEQVLWELLVEGDQPDADPEHTAS